VLLLGAGREELGSASREGRTARREAVAVCRHVAIQVHLGVLGRLARDSHGNAHVVQHRLTAVELATDAAGELGNLLEARLGTRIAVLAAHRHDEGEDGLTRLHLAELARVVRSERLTRRTALVSTTFDRIGRLIAREENGRPRTELLGHLEPFLDRLAAVATAAVRPDAAEPSQQGLGIARALGVLGEGLVAVITVDDDHHLDLAAVRRLEQDRRDVALGLLDEPRHAAGCVEDDAVAALPLDHPLLVDTPRLLRGHRVLVPPRSGEAGSGRRTIERRRARARAHELASRRLLRARREPLGRPLLRTTTTKRVVDHGQPPLSTSLSVSWACRTRRNGRGPHALRPEP